MKIYVASSWRNEFQPAVVEVCRSCNHEVYDFRNPAPGDHGFAWSEIDKNWRNWSTEEYMEALIHPISIKGFSMDFNGLQWADVCILVLPSGRSAHVEAGFMKGQGKDVYVFSPIRQEPELMYKLFDGIVSNVHNLGILLRELNVS